MKKSIFLFGLLIVVSIYPLFAKQKNDRDLIFEIGPNYKKVAFGTEVEMNMNSLNSFAPAACILFDVGLGKRFSMGVRGNLSYDKESLKEDKKIFTSEVLATMRLYISTLQNRPIAGFFIEVQGGESFIYINSELKNVFNAGVCAGYRFSNSSLYLEPQLRFGYPYLIGAGIATGLKF